MAAVAQPDFNIILNFYALALGFTVGGFCASSFALVTGQPLKFEMPREQSDLSVLIGMLFRLVAGPFMIIRNTLRAVMIAGREPYWVMMAIVISAIWSFCQGVLIVEAVCKLSACS